MLKRKTEMPRGVLHVPISEPYIGLERFEPSEKLRQFIEHFWSVTWNHQKRVLRETVPHPSIHLVIEPNASQLHGVHRKRFARWIEGSGRVLGIKFRPGGFRAFIQHEVKNLTDTIVQPSIVFGSSILDLESQVCSCSTAESAVERIDLYLQNFHPIATEDLHQVTEIVHRIAVDRSIACSGDIVNQFGIGLRTLQRLFSDYVGVSPKWVVQRYRLIDAAERIRHATDRIDFADLALQLGYSDQPHFIRDFKLMVGLTPAKYYDSIQIQKAKSSKEPLE